MRRRYKRQISKYEEQALNAEGKIIKIDYKNQIVGEKYKTVFYVPSLLCPEGRRCVTWGHTNINVGDYVELKGRFNDDIFLCWSIKIIRKSESLNEVTQ